jgi:hypothetical protein
MDRRLMFAGGSSLFMVMLLVAALSPSYWLALAVLFSAASARRASATCRRP